MKGVKGDPLPKRFVGEVIVRRHVDRKYEGREVDMETIVKSTEEPTAALMKMSAEAV
jgi:hypothetical protein